MKYPSVVRTLAVIFTLVSGSSLSSALPAGGAPSGPSAENPAAATGAPEQHPLPPTQSLFGSEFWYLSQKGKEQTFEGVLRRADQNHSIGFGRFNSFRLEMVARVREVYTGGKETLFEPYIGRQVRLAGKPVDMEVEGQQHHEIWPARIETLTESTAIRILARGEWPQPIEGPSTPQWDQHWVLRSEGELEQLSGPRGSLVVARSLKVQSIDFHSQMLIAVSGRMQPMVGVSGGGPPSALYRVVIRNVVHDDPTHSLIVLWQMLPREGAGLISNPIAIALVKRFEGPVGFKQLPVESSSYPGSPPAAPLNPAPTAMEDFQILGSALWPDGWKTANAPQTTVIRRYADLVDSRMMAPENVLERLRQERAQALAHALGVSAIDFDRQMVIAVSGGVQPTGGYRVEVTHIDLDETGGSATVHWQLRGPLVGGRFTRDLTHPGQILLINQFPGLIRFNP